MVQNYSNEIQSKQVRSSGWNDHIYKDRLGNDRLGYNTAEKDEGVHRFIDS